MQPQHKVQTKFTSWSSIGPPPSSLMSSLTFLADMGADSQHSSNHNPLSSVMTGLCSFPSTTAPPITASLTGVHHSDNSDNSAGRAFAEACFQSVSPPPVCKYLTCAGGSLGPDGTLKPCSLRKWHRGDNDAQSVQLSRGSLCTIHHPHIQCTGCERSVHEGCWASECMQPMKRTLWTCDVCARKKSEEALKASASETTVKSEGGLLLAKQEAGGSDKKVTVLFKSRESLLKMFSKEGFRVRSSRALAQGLRWIKFECCIGCNIKFSCRESEYNQWHVTDFPETHPCCDKQTVSTYHERTRTSPDKALELIQKLATSGAFDSKSIQAHLHTTHSWSISTDLIYMIGYRARVKMFGGTGCSDTAHLAQQQQERRALGDIYDLHYTQEGHLSHIVWVSSFAHLLLAYFDYFLCDGTHGISKYG
jgi:hypothetical protein